MCIHHFQAFIELLYINLYRPYGTMPVPGPVLLFGCAVQRLYHYITPLWKAPSINKTIILCVQTYIKYFTLDRPLHLFVCLWTHAAMSAICLLGPMCVPSEVKSVFRYKGLVFPRGQSESKGTFLPLVLGLWSNWSPCVSLLHHKTWRDKLQDCQIEKVKQQFIHPLPSPSPWSFSHTLQHTHNICLL
jgi:hypothetical protein